MNLTVQYKLNFLNARKLMENEWYLSRRKAGQSDSFPMGTGETRYLTAEDAIIDGMKIIDAEIEKQTTERVAERMLVDQLKKKGYDVYPGHV